MEDELDPRFDVTTAHFGGGGHDAGRRERRLLPGAEHRLRAAHRRVDARHVGGGQHAHGRARRGLDGAGDWSSSEELLIANTAQPEGDASKPAVPQPDDGLQLHADLPYRVGCHRHGAASEFEGDDDWDHQAAKKGIEHKKDIEYALMVGHPSEDTSSGQARRTTGGFNHYVTTNVTDIGGTMTELEFFTALRPCFRYGAKEKWGLVSALALDVLNTFPRGKLEFRQGEKTFGLRIVQYISPHGTLNVVTHWLLEGATLGGQIWISTPTS
jgi:hypothetical protein